MSLLFERHSHFSINLPVLFSPAEWFLCRLLLVIFLRVIRHVRKSLNEFSVLEMRSTLWVHYKLAHLLLWSRIIVVLALVVQVKVFILRAIQILLRLAISVFEVTNWLGSPSLGCNIKITGIFLILIPALRSFLELHFYLLHLLLVHHHFVLSKYLTPFTFYLW